jgi:hypothetical protein
MASKPEDASSFAADFQPVRDQLAIDRTIPTQRHATTRNASMNEIGIDMPIMMAGRTPSVATQVISTRAIAVNTAASSVRKRASVVAA